MDINHFYFAYDWFEKETVTITFNAKRYRKIIEQFYDDLNSTSHCRTWFMQDGTQLIPRKPPSHMYTNCLKFESLF